jgi:hypothetical protein
MWVEGFLFLREKLRWLKFLKVNAQMLATDPEDRVRFPALPDFLRSSGSGTGFTQPRDYN